MHIVSLRITVKSKYTATVRIFLKFFLFLFFFFTKKTIQQEICSYSYFKPSIAYDLTCHRYVYGSECVCLVFVCVYVYLRMYVCRWIFHFEMLIVPFHRTADSKAVAITIFLFVLFVVHEGHFAGKKCTVYRSFEYGKCSENSTLSLCFTHIFRKAHPCLCVCELLIRKTVLLHATIT